MLVDTHCHLRAMDGADLSGDVGNILARARDAGVGTLICATAAPDDVAPTLAVTQQFDNVFCTIGIHPEYANADPAQYLTDVVLQNPRVVGVGEIGLDYHYGTDTRGGQIELFQRQLDIARGAALPVAIHTRDADDDTADILTHADVRGVMHCFTSSWALAKKMLDRGFFFSASGILTFKNADSVRETFAKIPMDRIVIETDSPYCAPVPHRGRPCKPHMVVNTARVLADIKGLDMGTLDATIGDNVRRLYPKISL